MDASEKKLGDMVFNTPDGIELYRLASLKARIKLESNGLKVSRGPSARAILAGELGLTSRAPHERFLTLVQAKIDTLKAKILKDRLVVDEIGPDFKVMSCDRVGYVMAREDDPENGIHWRVSFYEGGHHGTSKPEVLFKDLALALDAAEKWVLEVR